LLENSTAVLPVPELDATTLPTDLSVLHSRVSEIGKSLQEWKPFIENINNKSDSDAHKLESIEHHVMLKIFTELDKLSAIK
jgi:hypothetical protein